MEQLLGTRYFAGEARMRLRGFSSGGDFIFQAILQLIQAVGEPRRLRQLPPEIPHFRLEHRDSHIFQGEEDVQVAKIISSNLSTARNTHSYEEESGLHGSRAQENCGQNDSNNSVATRFEV